MAKVRVNWGPANQDRSVEVYAVYNTNHNCLYVLATDAQRAMSVASTANHVYDVTTKIALDYIRLAEVVRHPPKDLQSHWETIGIAIARRLQGTLHCEGDRVYVGDKLITE